MVEKVLILTASKDIHADEVYEKLVTKGVSVVRFNSDAITPSQFMSIDEDGICHLTIGTAVFDATDFQSVWYRKPQLWYTNYTQFTPREAAEHDFKLTESVEMCKEFMLAIEEQESFVVSPYSSLANASRKIHQIKVARNIGFEVPDSIVTTSPVAIENFLATHNGVAVSKGMWRSGIRYGSYFFPFYTTKLDYAKFKEYVVKDDTCDYPMFLQQMIYRDKELRVTVIGKRVFACEMDTERFNEDIVDIKTVGLMNLNHAVHSLPIKIENACLELCRHFKLQYAAIDMAVTPEGKYVFIEINPNGQYLWIEKLTGLPLSQAMADLLIHPEENSLF